MKKEKFEVKEKEKEMFGFVGKVVVSYAVCSVVGGAWKKAVLKSCERKMVREVEDHLKKVCEEL